MMGHGLLCLCIKCIESKGLKFLEIVAFAFLSPTSYFLERERCSSCSIKDSCTHVEGEQVSSNHEIRSQPVTTSEPMEWNITLLVKYHVLSSTKAGIAMSQCINQALDLQEDLN